MLTSPSNQYLRPEYLTPLPTTLDAKKSPLALLAQTCSQIGADAPNSKLLQSAEKSSRSNNKSDQSKDKNPSLDSHHKQSTNNNNNHNNSKQYDVLSREKSRSPEERSGSASTGSRVRTPQQLKNSSTNNGRCSSNQSAASPRASPAISERKTPANSEGNINIEQTTPKSSSERASPSTPASSSSSSSSSASLSSTTATKTAFTPNILTSSSDPAIKDLPLGTFKPGVPVTSAFLGSYPPNAFPLPMDLMTSSLMSQHHALKTGGLSPYLSYGRMKTADSLSTVCRDPYCTGCGLSSHLLSGKGSNPCPAGCTQCDHAKAPPPTTTTTASYLGAAYAHAQLAALAAASHLPYACSWISGDASYCGKRFATSEELLSHLRTHTNTSSVSEANSAALSMLSTPPTHPLLHRTYPTPPLSPLATARYHPYSKPSPLLPPSLTSSLPGFPLSHPGLPPYLSPYSLYGPRLGATPGMHP